MKNKKTAIISLIALVSIFIIGAVYYKSNNSSTNVDLTNVDVHSAPYVRDYSVKFGKNKNNITIVEFMDPFCTSCAAFNPSVKKVLHDYNDEVQLVTRYLTYQKNIPEIIKILEASREQNLYEETLKAVFGSQHIWGDYKFPRPQLVWNYVVQVPNINIDKLREDMKNPKIIENVKQDIEDAKELGVTGTPTIFVNGRKLENLSYEDLNELVESEIYK